MYYIKNRFSWDRCNRWAIQFWQTGNDETLCAKESNSLRFFRNEWTEYPIFFFLDEEDKKVIQDDSKLSMYWGTNSYTFPRKIASQTLKIAIGEDFYFVQDQLGSDNYLIIKNVRKIEQIEIKNTDSSDSEFIGCSNDECFFERGGKILTTDTNGNVKSIQGYGIDDEIISYPFFDFDNDVLMIGHFDFRTWNISVSRFD